MTRVLLVEAEPDSRELLTMLLELSGFAVDAAASGQAASALLDHVAYDVVVTELRAAPAHVDAGLAAFADLVRQAHPTPVGVLSGWAVDPALLSARGAAFALRKPARATDLLAAISTTLALPPLAAAQREVVQTYFSALEQADYDRLVTLCTPDVVYHLPHAAAPLATTAVGREAFRAITESTFATFQEPRFEVEETRHLPRGALVEYQGSWRDSDGHRRRLPGTVLFAFDGTAIAEIGIRIDLAQLA